MVNDNLVFNKVSKRKCALTVKRMPKSEPWSIPEFRSQSITIERSKEQAVTEVGKSQECTI
jgi:hypothetical protein